MAATGALSGAVRSYPTSEVRGRSREDPMPEGGAAKRSYPTSKVRDSGRECQAVMMQEWRRGETPCLRSRVVAGRSYPMSKERWLHGHRRA